MTSPHWAEVRFLVPPLSKWSAISSDMKVFKSTSWSPFLLRLALEPLLTWVGEPGVLERTLILAIAPLRPRGKKERVFRSNSKESLFPVCGRRDDIWLLVTLKAPQPVIYSTLIWSPDHTFPVFSPYKNLAIARTGFLWHQKLTHTLGCNRLGNTSSISMASYLKYIYTLKNRLFQAVKLHTTAVVTQKEKKIPNQGLSRLT